MNVICNSCVGARLYELRNMQFNNPFMWNVIPYKDFSNLMKYYDTIDLSKFDVSIFHQSETNRVALALFDSVAKVYYIHYHLNEAYKRPTVKSIDVYSDNIIQYTTDAINRRLGRMNANREKPIFLFETRNRNRYNGVYTETDIKEFIELPTDYTKILLVNQPKFKNYPEVVKNCYILYYEDKRPDLPPDTTHMAMVVYEKFKELFE